VHYRASASRRHTLLFHLPAVPAATTPYLACRAEHLTAPLARGAVVILIAYNARLR